MKSEEYRIERLDINKLKDLAALYKAVYGSEQAKDYFPKKYNTAYTGLEFIGYIAYSHKNRPVAFYGVIPCFIQYKSEIVLSAQATDAMTHPQHRYRGLFVKLAVITFDLCKASGITFIFGFPNQNSYHGLFHKLHWQMTESMDCFVIPVNTFPLESLSQKFKWTKWVYTYYTKWILRKYLLLQQGLSNSVITDEYGGVYRDKPYVQYKTFSSSQVLKIGRAKVWIRIKSGLLIGDIDLEGSKDNFDVIMKTITRIARRLGVVRISSQMSPCTQIHALFSGRYEPVPSFPIVFLSFGTDIPFNKLKFTLADIDIF